MSMKQASISLEMGYDAYLGSEEINKILIKIRDGNWENEDLKKWGF